MESSRRGTDGLRVVESVPLRRPQAAEDMAPHHILLIDDDPKFRRYVAAGLEASGLECTAAADGEAALAVLDDVGAASFALILLDIMMPRLMGWELLRILRERGLDTPVIFVTAREGIDERVRGLQLGADDYVIKPFAFPELLARIEAVLRRGHRQAGIRFGEVLLDLDRRTVQHGETCIPLSPKECDVLHVLIQARGSAVSREDLLREVWQTDLDPGTNVVDVHVARLRRRLGSCGALHIETVRGKGYSIGDGPADPQ